MLNSPYCRVLINSIDHELFMKTNMLAYYRGGASEASVATFTNHVAGNRAISYTVVYPSYITCVNTRACANGAEIAIFEIIFHRERKLWEKKTCCSGVGSNLGLMHCRPLHLPPSQWGLWQLWTANLALILLTAAMSVDYSERPWMAIMQGYLEKANRLRHYKVYLLYSLAN